MGGPLWRVHRIVTELLQMLLFEMMTVLASDDCHTVKLFEQLYGLK